MRPVLKRVHRIAVTHAGFIDLSLTSCAFDVDTSSLTVPSAWQRPCLVRSTCDTTHLRLHVAVSDMRIWLACSLKEVLPQLRVKLDHISGTGVGTTVFTVPSS